MDPDRIIHVLRQADQPLSTNQVADKLDVDWHTADRHLNKLVKQNKVFRTTVSDRLTLYWDRKIPF